MKFKELNCERIVESIKTNKNISSILNSLDCVDNSFNRDKLKKFINDNNIDISHLIKPLTKEEYDKNPKRCKYCNEIIPFEQRNNDFCNHSCAASFNNGTKTKHMATCLNCGKTFLYNRSKFCSQKCKNEFSYNEYINNWKLGKESRIIGVDDISNYVRRYLFDKFNNKCQKCGWGEVNEFTNKVPLQIHHIYGNCLNNMEDNLMLLCPNCHSLTENFGSRNKNSTRVDKRKR